MIRFFYTGLIFISLTLPSCETKPEQPVENRSVEVTEFANSDELGLKEIKFVCNDDFLRPFWIDLLHEAQFTSQLFCARLSSTYDCSEMLKLEAVDLNEDGKNEYLIYISSVCSPTANCPMAVYGVFDDERSKFHTSAGIYDFSRRKLLFHWGMRFEVQQTKSNGYRDLLVRFNGGNYDDKLFFYKFNGEAYELKKCFTQDKRTELKTSTLCNES